MKDKRKKDVKVLINNKKHVKLFDKDISTLYVLKSSVVSDTIEVKVKKEVKLCHQAIQIAQLMHVPSENFMSEDFVQKVFEEAWKYGSEVFAVKEAVIWGDNFKFPESVFNRDLEELRGYDMSLQTLCVERSLRVKHKEFSVSRVMDSCTVLKSINEQQHMDIVSALDIAQHGVHIFTLEHFIPCAIPPPMRQIYITVASAVNKTIFEMYNNGQVLILPSNIVKTLPDVHFSPMYG
jgi:hypothetical protein